jgi:hypothetical protein
MDRARGVSPAEAGWITKLLYRALQKRLGRVPKSKTLAAHNTPALLASTWMDAIGASAKTIPAVLKELAQLKVAAPVGCPF